MKTELFSIGQKFLIFQVLHFSFSHLSVLCVSPILPPHNNKKKEYLLGEGIFPHTLLAFYFLVADILYQVRSCTSKNLILCPTPQQTQVSTLGFKAFCLKIQRVNLWNSHSSQRTKIVAIITSHIHILGSKPKLYLNKNKPFHGGNQRQCFPPSKHSKHS